MRYSFLTEARLAKVATLFVLGTSVAAWSAGVDGSMLLDCQTISLARPGMGVPYTDLVRNSDYRFTLKIPDGMTGWGAAPGAPFHGFTVYVDHAPIDKASCIDFRISSRVELPGDTYGSEAGIGLTRTVRVGNRKGTETRISGLIGETAFENIAVSLSIPRADRTDDVFITLVAPKSAFQRALSIYRRLLSNISFW
jgi:hypothetical protein